MTLHEQVDGKQALARFVEALREDLQTNPAEWENPTLDRFLEALAGGIQDSDGFYINQGTPVPTSIVEEHRRDADRGEDL